MLSKRLPLAPALQALLMNMTPVMVMMLLPSPQKMRLMLTKNMNSGMVTAIFTEIYTMTIGNNGGGTEWPRRLAQRPPRRPPKDLRGSRAADFARRRVSTHQSCDGIWRTLSSRATTKSTCRTSGKMTAADIRMPTLRLQMTTPVVHIVKVVSQVGTLPMPLKMLMMMVVIRIAGAATNIMSKRNTFPCAIKDFIVKDAPQIGTLTIPWTKLMTMVTIVFADAATNIMGKINIIPFVMEDFIGKAAPQGGTLPIRLMELMMMVVTMNADDATNFMGKTNTIPLLTLLTEPRVMVLTMTTDAAVNIMGKMNTIPRTKRETSVSQPGSTSPAICIGKSAKSVRELAWPRRKELPRPATRQTPPGVAQ